MSRILNMMAGKAVAQVIIEIMKENASNLGDILAVDGKAIRSTIKDGKPHSALQILTAYLTESGVVLGQGSIHEKTNEIPVFQEMLGFLCLAGKTVTADAMHCQKETCKRIINKGGDYVFGLKENQKNLYDDVALFINASINAQDMETYTTREKNGGRVEKRVCKNVADISWLQGREEWTGLKSVFAITRTITSSKGTTEETNCCIASLAAPSVNLLVCK